MPNISHFAMTKEQEVDTLEQVSWMQEEKSFPFFDLPEVVQWKILREYVPVLTKTHTLGQVSQFSDLLRTRSAWVNVSAEYSELVSVLGKLQEGLYVKSEEFPKFGYYVSMEPSKNTVEFTRYYDDDRYFFPYSKKQQKFSASTTVSNLRDFIEKFLKRYRPVEENPIMVYRFPETNQTIFINVKSNIVMWTDEKTYKIEHNKCEIKNPIKSFIFSYDYYSNDISFSLQNDNQMFLQYYDREYKLKPKTLESHLLYNDTYFNRKMQKNSKEKVLTPSKKKCCRFKISLKNVNEIFVRLWTFFPLHCMHFSECILFDMLSESTKKYIRSNWSLK